jgi:hypothetical protein
MVLIFASSLAGPPSEGINSPAAILPVKITDERPGWERIHCVGKNRGYGGGKKAVFFALEDFRPTPLDELRTQLGQCAQQMDPTLIRLKLELLSFKVVYKESPEVQTVFWEGGAKSPPSDLPTQFGPDLTCLINVRATLIGPNKQRTVHELRGTMNSGFLDPRGYRQADLDLVIGGAITDCVERLKKQVSSGPSAPSHPSAHTPASDTTSAPSSQGFGSGSGLRRGGSS